VKQASAQAGPAATAIAEIKPLKIGDKVPDELWKLPLQVVNYPGGKSKVTLDDYRGKLIILDFWATWCSACLAGMPKMHKLQNQFADDLTVLPITKENNPEKLLHFLENSNAIKDLKIFTVFGDTTFNKMFDHRLIPHYVWIGSNGTVEAITSTFDINQQNIKAILEGSQMDGLGAKKDVDPNLPLIGAKDIPLSKIQGSFVLYKGRLEGTGSGYRARDFGELVGVTWNNLPLVSIFKKIGSHFIENFNDKQLLIEMDNSSELIFKGSVEDRERWNHANVYTLEFLTKKKNYSTMYEEILHQLNSQLDFQISIQTKETKCLVLRKSNNKFPETEGGAYINSFYTNKLGQMRNVPVSHLIAWLNNRKFSDLLVIDDTQTDSNIDLTLDTELPDLASLQKILKNKGLILEGAIMPIEFMLIRKKK